MLQIDNMSRVPVYEQITSQIKKFVSLGILKEGDKLDSVRSLSLSLSVNPNTIQKAFNELDSQEIITSVPGRGNFIAEGAVTKLLSRNRDRLKNLCYEAKELATLGISKDEIIDSLKSALE